MDKDYRWKIWLYIPEDLPDLLAVFQSFFQADDLYHDCENVWEWLVGYSTRFKTAVDLARQHHNGDSMYSEPLVVMTDFSPLDRGHLEKTTLIALALTKIFNGPVFYGYAISNRDHSFILEHVGRYSRENIAVAIAGRDGNPVAPRRWIVDNQDRHSAAWKTLCAYIDEMATIHADEFIPLSILGAQAFSAIQTLPASIGTLKQVTKMHLYGSSLRYLPPEIGDCSALTHFDPYTSYDLHWFPYEITRCTALKSSRVSTRALYGNYKTRMPFPDLRTTVIQYESEDLSCSVCGKPITYAETNQVWISLWVATDVLPLLVNACSTTCIDALPTPPEGYLPWPHKGGQALLQPLPDEDSFRIEMEAIEARDHSL